jgi:hypothetical protein
MCFRRHWTKIEKENLMLRKRLFSLITTTSMLLLCAALGQAQNITGSGTNGYIPKFTGTTTIGNSVIRTSGSTVAIGAAPLSGYKFYVLSSESAIKADSTSAAGVAASGSSFGVYASAINTGVFGLSSGGAGVAGSSTTGVGVQGISDSGLAGWFQGSVNVSNYGSNPGNLAIAGTLSKGGGSFKIDHPLDPENKYLYHSFVESPDMMNVYNGNTTTDENGDAVVELPSYFEALNKDFRYQLTVVGMFAQAMVSNKIKSNRFTIKTNAPNVEVSWQVTGIRRDQWANHNRIPVEEEKPERERGYYLHPNVFDQPEERGIEWARHPEMMRQPKESTAQAPSKPNMQ